MRTIPQRLLAGGQRAIRYHSQSGGMGMRWPELCRGSFQAPSSCQRCLHLTRASPTYECDSCDGVVATDPASASTGRIDACFAIRAFAGVRTVCRQSRAKLIRNEIGKVAARPASARQSALTRRSDRAQISHTKPRNAVQRRTCAAFRKQWRKSAPPIRLGTNTREHDSSGYKLTAGVAHTLKKALNLHNFNSRSLGRL